MNSPPHYHLVGIGGAGMNALAQVLVAQGARVSGSDRAFDQGPPLAIFRKLAALGMRILPQDGRGVTSDRTGVVFSTAIEADNPDLSAARSLGIPLLHRAELLAHCCRNAKLVGVAGTSGKTTVTGMLGWVLEQTGLDPVVVNGGNLVQWEDADRIGNVRAGGSDLWVVELDESDRSLLHFAPEWTVLTNISHDHFAISEARELFDTLATHTRRTVVPPLDPADLDAHIRGYQASPNGVRFDVDGTRYRVAIPGRHTAMNALQTIRMCSTLGLAPNRIAHALAAFAGIRRRLEHIHAGPVTVVDDYAHNPAKIRASWAALAPHHARVLAIWRPHGFGPLALLLDEIVETFATLCRAQDRLFILPVYYAGGTARRTTTARDLVARLRDRSLPANLAADYNALGECLLREAKPGDLILSMGARDPELPLFARTLADQLTRAFGD